MQLPAYGSGFIVFRNVYRELPPYNKPTEIQSTEIKTPWTLSFPDNWGAPSFVELSELISWTDHENKGINYFSGTASYKNSFIASKKAVEGDNFISLDLGEVLDVAEIFVNEKPVGIVWTKPFRLNIKDYVKEGENQVEIKITNMWINRLTGDINLPDDEKICRTNRPYITNTNLGIGDETYRVQKAGLMGPVTIVETARK
jgi:hypothetical protein